MNPNYQKHYPVMLCEVLDSLDVSDNKVYVDAMLIYDDESMELFVRKTGIDKIVNLSKYEDDEVLSFAKTLAEKRSIEEYKLYKTKNYESTC
jgi:16S rRNA C1402 N4-methylase RsmH